MVALIYVVEYLHRHSHRDFGEDCNTQAYSIACMNLSKISVGVCFEDRHFVNLLIPLFSLVSSLYLWSDACQGGGSYVCYGVSASLLTQGFW